jgi:hypothetical protein
MQNSSLMSALWADRPGLIAHAVPPMYAGLCRQLQAIYMPMDKITSMLTCLLAVSHRLNLTRGNWLPMEIHQVVANPQVEEDRNKIALERGPLVYCVEGTDNHSLNDLIFIDNMQLTTNFEPRLLNGIQVIRGKSTGSERSGTGVYDFMAIPYYSWDNRGDTPMKVWISSK